MNHVDGYVGIHFRDINKSNPNNYGNNVLRKELGNLGIGTYIVPNINAYNIAEKTATIHPIAPDSEEIKLLDQQDVELTESGLSVVRARLNTPRGLEEIIPVINGMKVRDIGASKWEQYELAGEYMPGTIALEANQEFTPELIDSLRGDTLVAKADKSQDSKHIEIASRYEMAEAVANIRAKFAQKESETGKPLSNKRILLQEFVAGDKWPGLQAADEVNSRLMQSADSLELRAYCFVDRNKKREISDEHHATARSVFNGTDEWIHVDQGSVPQDAWEIARTISTKLLDKAGVQSGYFVVDLVTGKEPTTGADKIYVREINTRDAMMVDLNENKADAIAQRRLLASMLASVARRSL